MKWRTLGILAGLAAAGTAAVLWLGRAEPITVEVVEASHSLVLDVGTGERADRPQVGDERAIRGVRDRHRHARRGRREGRYDYQRGDDDERQCDEKWQKWYFLELSQWIHCFSFLCPGD